MKKLLLASVAILAIAAFAAGQAQAADAQDSGLKLTVGGYLSVQGAYVSQSDSVGQPGHNLAKTDIFQYGELHFTAEKTFDNGLTVGYEGVLDDGTDSTAGGNVLASFRQDFAYFSGNWGRLEAGQNYSPLYYMSMGAPAVNDEFDSIDPDFSLVSITSANTSLTGGSTGVASSLAASHVGTGNYATVGFTPFYRGGQDSLLADKVVYYTPRFNGFQLGADYAPSPNRTGDGTKSALGGMVNDNLPATTAAGAQDERYDIAAGYDGTFSGVGVKASGGYGHSTLENSGTSFAGGKDEQGYIGGAQLSYMNWTLGGGYVWDNNGQKFTSGTLSANGDTKIWNAGLGYAVGPYHAGVTYQQSSTDVLRDISTVVASDDQLKRWVVGGGYKVAPGVDLETTLQFDKYQTANPSGANANPLGNNNATVFTVGSTVNF